MQTLQIRHVSPAPTVVGYSTKTVQAMCNATFALQFEDLTGAKPVAVDQLVLMGDDEHASSTGWGSDMDQIWRWDSTEGVDTWAKYGYVKEGGGRTGLPETYSWKKYNYNGDKKFVALTEADVVQPGETFLFFRGGSNPVTLTLSGGVREFTSSKTFTIKAMCNQFIAYPWPVDFPIGDMEKYYAAPASSTGWGSDMDQIWRWDSTEGVDTWAKYGYLKEGGGRTGLPETYTWKKYNYNGDKKFYALTEADVIKPGEGFLFFRGGSADANIEFYFGEKKADD